MGTFGAAPALLTALVLATFGGADPILDLVVSETEREIRLASK
jgi:hypothetical protein